MSMFPPGFSETPARHTVNLLEVPPFLRMILVADGTVTKLLEAFFLTPIQIRIIAQDVTDADPFETGASEQVLSRAVVLDNAALGQTYGYATSFTVLRSLGPELREALLTGRIGIGALLRQQRMETFREHVSIRTREAGDSAGPLQISSGAPVVERTYRIFTNRKPLVQICEVFPIEIFLH